MSLITRMRKQKAVWWQRLTCDQFGTYTYAAPVEIDCRWDDAALEFQDHKGQKLMSQAIAYVDRTMSVGDRLKKGDLDSNIGSDPLQDNLAFEIHRFDQNPNLRNTENLLSAYLAGHSAYAG